MFQPNQFTNDEYRGAEVDELSDMENDNTAQDDDPVSKIRKTFENLYHNCSAILVAIFSPLRPVMLLWFLI